MESVLGGKAANLARLDVLGASGSCLQECLSVSRKIRAPEDEIEGVDTYTRVFGTYGAAWVVLLIRVIDTGLVALVGWHLGLAPWFYAALVALFLVCLVGFFDYRLHTSRKTAKRMELYAGIYIIAFDVILAAAIVARYGVRV